MVIRPRFSVDLMSPLHVAGWAGLTSVAKILVNAGYDRTLNEFDEGIHTPLYLAVQKGHTETVAFLLDCGALPDPPDECGLSALHFAAKSNHHPVVRLLLAAGVSPLIKKAWNDPGLGCGNAPTTVGDTPLEYASQSGYVESVGEMIPYMDADSCVLALQIAVRFRHTALVKLLIEPAGVDIKSPLAGNLLLRAGSNRDVDTMKFLLSKGVNPCYRRERHGLDLRIYSSEQEMPDEDSLLLAICDFLEDQKVFRIGSVEVPLEPALNLALEAGCDVNATGWDGTTPLHYCVRMTTVSSVQRLLDRGADVHARDSGGNTPLHLFRPSSKSLPILDILLRHGARWDAAGNHKGQTPLHVCLAGWGGDDDLGIIAPFVEDWNTQDADGDTPLHILARRTGHMEHTARLIEQLISFGADLDRRNNAGKVPLHEVSAANIDFFGPVFAGAGANLEARDKQGRTWFLRLVASCPHGWPKAVELGVDRNAVDIDGNNALHLTCADSSAEKNIKYLLETGVDPLHVNHRHDTLYHTLMRQYFERGHSNLGTLCLLRSTDIPVLVRNKGGETLLHCFFSTSPEWYAAPNLLDPTRNPLCQFEQREIASMISMRDNEGRLPIHVAAASSEYYAGWLIGRGAEVFVQTYKKQNLLHLAAVAKQCNVIGLVLEAYGNAERRAAVNGQDDQGHTPLHYACQSGRPESVRLLLDAGADPNLRDRSHCTPLHLCADFRRNPVRSGFSSELYARSDDDTLRVKDIVHLLCRHGAGITSSDLMMDPIEYAMHTESDLMAVALSDEINKEPLEQKSKYERYTAHFLWRQLVCAHQNASSIVDQMTLDESTDIVDICKEALAAGAFSILNELADRGVQPRRKTGGRSEDFLHTLARWGFTEQFEKFGSRRVEDSWINGSLSSPDSDYPGVRPFILTVAESSLPNMALLSLIAETFKADVNIKDPKHDRLEIDSCALHILAQGTHWWQIGAIKYLLDHGADANITDAFGRNALHVAVTGGYQRMRIVKLLLENGADPNASSEDGTTPLGLLERDGDMVKLLIEFGADIMAGEVSLFSRSIQTLNTDMLEAILTTDTDCNQQVHKIRHPYSFDTLERMPLLYVSLGSSDGYALQLAALWGGKSEMERVKVAATVQLLLDHGADPFAPLNQGTTILHDLLSQNAMVDTFLAQPNIEIDRRDARGRTLLLAACHSPEKGYSRDINSVLELIRKLWDMGADIRAATNEGNTVAHLLLRISEPGEDEDGVAAIVGQLFQECPSLAHQQNVAGYSPIHIAAKRRLFRFVRQLKDAGADIRTPDPEGNTILHYVVPNMSALGEDILEEYLTLGLNINARNNDGLTPVWKHFADGAKSPAAALSSQNIETVRQAGADLFGRNGDGESLLHLVAGMKTYGYDHQRAESLSKDTGMFKYLLGLGLDPLLEDNKQRTPIDVAAAYGKDGILELFRKK